jgi:putative spermidine/putrescine transport system substrate-binding protein
MAYDGDKLKTAQDLGRFLGRQEVPGQARHAQGRALQPGIRADGRWREAGRRLQGAGHQGRRRSRLQEDDELKANIQWWEAGAQPPQFLVAGDVVMATAFNGRIDAAQREGKNLKITWTGGIYDLDYWVIPKGSPNKDLAMKYIALAASPDAQAEYARNISYGPTNSKALTKLDAKVLALLPTSPANAKDSLKFDIGFWADQGEALEKRFASWAAQ